MYKFVLSVLSHIIVLFLSMLNISFQYSKYELENVFEPLSKKPDWSQEVLIKSDVFLICIKLELFTK